MIHKHVCTIHVCVYRKAGQMLQVSQKERDKKGGGGGGGEFFRGWGARWGDDEDRGTGSYDWLPAYVCVRNFSLKQGWEEREGRTWWWPRGRLTSGSLGEKKKGTAEFHGLTQRAGVLECILFLLFIFHSSFSFPLYSLCTLFLRLTFSCLPLSLLLNVETILLYNDDNLHKFRIHWFKFFSSETYG